MTWWKIYVKGKPDYEAAKTEEERDFLKELAELAVTTDGVGGTVVVEAHAGDPPKFELPEHAPWD